MTLPADIICFAKDWSEPKTSNNHVMEELSKRHRVLWVNSISTRSPNLASSNDLKKIMRKVCGWFRGAQIINNNLRVLTPISLPFPQWQWAQCLSRWVVRWSVSRAARRWGFRTPQVWCFLPNAVDFLGSFQESVSIYYCTDDWSGFTHLNTAYMRQKEEEMLRKVNVVFAVSQTLLDAKKPHNANTFLMRHGVNHTLFAQALQADYPVAVPLRDLPHPVIGYYGNVYDYFDQGLLCEMAQAQPRWSFVIVGKLMTDVAVMRRHPNIHLLERCSYEDLPQYCKGFDAAIVVYRPEHRFSQSANPLKLREYLAAGLPVVSLDVPESRALSPEVKIAKSATEFLAQLEQAIATDTMERRRARSESMRAETWEERVEEMLSIIASHAAQQVTS